MMASYRRANRKMFWRIVGHLLVANPSRLFVILLALGSGAAITAALLNLQIDAKRRLTTEFRSFGPNAIVAPRSETSDSPASRSMDDSIVTFFQPKFEGNYTGFPFLFSVAKVKSADSRSNTQAVVAGTDLGVFGLSQLGWKLDDLIAIHFAKDDCLVGARLASSLKLGIGSSIQMNDGDRFEACRVRKIIATGGSEDDQVILFLEQAQHLAGAEHKVSMVKVLISGDPAKINQTIIYFQSRFPGLDVRPIRQFTEGEAKIYNRISGLLTATVLIILVLTFFCVMAAMTNVAMERRNDVGLMKALGGSVRRIVRLFFAEAALLGLTGGLIGSTIGILLSIWLGKAVFGLAARPRMIVYPIAIMLTLLVSLASALPLRRLAGIRPASVFRGEA